MNALPQAKPAGQFRLEHVDGLRALAAMYVVMNHIMLYVFFTLPVGKVRKVSNFFGFGHTAVDVFIVLSGFCLMLPIIRSGGKISGGPLNFLLKRARRILPPYFAVLVLSLVLIWLFIPTTTPESMWHYCVPVTWPGFLAHIFLVQDWFPNTNYQINYVLWSISVEWRIYFILPVLVYCWNRFGALQTVAVTTVTSFLLLIPFQHTPFDASAGGVCLHFYALFTFGMLAAGFAYSDEPALVKWRARLPWGFLCAVMIALYFTANKGYVHQIRLPWQVQDLFAGLATLCLLVAVTPSESSDTWGWVRNALGWRPLAAIGAFSYSLYLVHAPLLEIIWAYGFLPFHMSPVKEYLLFSAAGPPVVIGLAYLFFLVCEHPFIRRPGGPVKGAGSGNPISAGGAEPAASALAR